MIVSLFILSALIFLGGCSRKYAPDSRAAGEQIYRAFSRMPQAKISHYALAQSAVVEE